MSDLAVIALLLAAFLVAAFISWRADRRADRARRPKRPECVMAVVRIPYVASGDGRPIQPETLAALEVRLALEIGVRAHQMHHAVMDEVRAQIARDEAGRVDLDDLLREAS